MTHTFYFLFYNPHTTRTQHLQGQFPNHRRVKTNNQRQCHTTGKHYTKNITCIQHVNTTHIQHEIHTTRKIQHKVGGLGADLEALCHYPR